MTSDLRPGAGIDVMDVDPTTRALLEELSAQGLLPGDYRDATYLHALDALLAETNGAGPPMAMVRDEEVAGIRVRYLSPTAQPIGIVAYFTGGWVPHSSRHVEPALRKLAERTNCVFAVVDAATILHAGAVEPGPLVSQLLVNVASKVGSVTHDQAPLFVAGDGPGASLALTAATLGSELGEEAALAVLISPLIPGTDRSAVGLPPPEWQTLTCAAVEDFDATYGGLLVHPLGASPVVQVPPVLIVTAQHDPLVADGDHLARLLRDAGVHVDQLMFPRQLHGFTNVLSLVVGELAFQAIVRAVRRIAIPRIPHAAHTSTFAPGSLDD